MSQSGSIVIRVVAALLLIAVLAGGGYMVFQAGQAQGYALGASSVTTTSGQTPESAGAAAVPFYGPGAMGRYHHFSPFMGFFGIFPALIGLCFVFFLLRLVFWGPRHMHYGHWAYRHIPCYPWPGEPPFGDQEHAKTRPESRGPEEAEKK